MKVPVLSVITGVVLAGIIHISIVLLIPAFASQDAWNKLVSIGQEWQLLRLNSSNVSPGEVLSSVDPLFQIAACRFSLSDRSLRVHAEGELPFWSVAVFDRYGNNIYSFNNRTAINQQLNLVVVNPVQMLRLRRDPPATVEKAIVVETDIKQGFVLLRVLQPDASWAPVVDKFLSDANCNKFAT